MTSDDSLRELWQAHLADSFPPSAHDIDDHSPELLDTEIAGIVSTFLHGSSELRADHRRWLRDAVSDLDRLLPQLDSDAARYFNRLRMLAAEVLDHRDRIDQRVDRSQMEAWLGEVQGVLIEVEDALTAQEAQRVARLIEHGEPAEGLLILSWILQDKHAEADSETRPRIKELAGDLVEEDSWPPAWRSL